MCVFKLLVVILFSGCVSVPPRISWKASLRENTCLPNSIKFHKAAEKHPEISWSNVLFVGWKKPVGWGHVVVLYKHRDSIYLYDPGTAGIFYDGRRKISSSVSTNRSFNAANSLYPSRVLWAAYLGSNTSYQLENSR